MELVLAALLTLAACGCLNTFAGGRFIPDEALRGRNLYYATPLLALVAYLWGGWQLALAFAFAFAFWRVWAWGFLFGLGRAQPTDRQPSWIEALCLEWASGQPHVAFYLRHLMAIPGGVAVAFVTDNWAHAAIPFALAAGIVIAYEIGWQWQERVDDASNPILTGEVGAGILWGAWIVFAGL